MEILTVIPARGGSKRLHRKNIVNLMGKPLIAYSIECALNTPALNNDDVIISTEDDEIAAVARQFGANVPFKRPAELSTDSAKSIDFMQHALHFMEDKYGKQYDALLLLQPTCPLREPQDIEEAIRIYQEQGADSLISLYELDAQHPFYAFKLENDLPVRALPEAEQYIGKGRKAYPKYYMLSGAIYLTARSVILNGGFYGDALRSIVMPADRSVNIDNPIELAQAEAIMRMGANNA